ncbi:MAG: anhydro-N-acetylmuramic acid kinase [Gammaproteobacteria bacterium]|nr:anhydro-N-acetylmuramic acid kinase [Gammaproteobacteria bacterium]NNL45441.1 anhydro-N-acetylmuramic acid kinase [Woeseiaceae bacterium]
MPDYYIGLISGTSMDGIDAVLASFGDDALRLHATHVHSYPHELRSLLQNAIRSPDSCGLDQVGLLDRWVGECFRDAALELVEKSNIDRDDVTAIGSHGQTLRHRPDAQRPFSLQIGDAAIIAAGTGIATVADFRRADIAAGGQGAPLVPPFHDWLFRSRDVNRVVLNIGGIANITVLPAHDAPVLGFDTGPGNTLLDAWIRERRDLSYDRHGEWAADGELITSLLDKLLADDYFDLSPPKSTGLEHFSLSWLNSFDVGDYDPGDVQATLSELTARTVADAIDTHAPATQELYVCGGGVHNQDLLHRLAGHLGKIRIANTVTAGLDPDWVEAVAFAWLAMRTMKQQSGNLPSVTGASRTVVLGAIHSP